MCDRFRPSRTPGKNVDVLDELIEVEPLEVDRWCRNHLGSGINEELFLYGHMSVVIGIRLNSGLQVVVKIRRASDRLVACASAHRVLFERGFPCPEPLIDLAPFGKGVASVEEMTVGGDLFPVSGRSPEPFAEALAHLVALAPKPEELGTFDPAPPWTLPPFGTDLWPWPDDRDIDLTLGPRSLARPAVGPRVATAGSKRCGSSSSPSARPERRGSRPSPRCAPSPTAPPTICGVGSKASPSALSCLRLNSCGPPELEIR